MKLTFKNDIMHAQPDPFICEIPGGWAMYVTGEQGVEAYFCETPFGQWEYRGIVCQKEGWTSYWAPCMYYAEDGYYHTAAGSRLDIVFINNIFYIINSLSIYFYIFFPKHFIN